jgi:deoxyribose-phosphate aldolase
LAKTVDHTVLKLDANSVAIDGMCAEARTEGFKVRFYIHCSSVVFPFIDSSMLQNPPTRNKSSRTSAEPPSSPYASA